MFFDDPVLALSPAQRFSTLDKKSRSTWSFPIFSYRSATTSAETASGSLALPFSNTAAALSRSAFFQVEI